MERRLLLLLAWPLACHSACYFSIELQGQFLMQSAVAQGAGAGAASAVRYSQVNITPDAIPIWGHCHRRLGRNVILMDSSGVTKCIRCFHLNLRSANVLQVHTEGLDKCYISEQAAEASCPDEAQPHVGRQLRPASEIILYKTREPGGAQARPQYCPISGRFSFTSRGSGGGLSPGLHRDCPLTEMSGMDSCPLGSALNLRYRNCNFPDFDVTYACLGHWEGHAGQRFLALLNRDVDSYPRYPRYRCALYAEDPPTGTISMAFSSDSTCHSDLRNASWGYEVLQLTAGTAPAWPESVEQSACRLPTWAQGRWQHLAVAGRSLVYRDHATFKTYTARCLWADAHAERFLVFAHTQCGEQMYTCLWLKQRSVNVLELQMGLRNRSDGSPSLCEDSYFKPDTWITQGRLERGRETPCPISGEHTGLIPDAQGLCARLASDCRSPERMYYTVSECSQAEVYEGSRWRSRRRRRQAMTGLGPEPVALPTARIAYIRTPPPRTGQHGLAPTPATAPTQYEEEYDPWMFGKGQTNSSSSSSGHSWGHSSGSGQPGPTAERDQWQGWPATRPPGPGLGSGSGWGPPPYPDPPRHDYYNPAAYEPQQQPQPSLPRLQPPPLPQPPAQPQEGRGLGRGPAYGGWPPQEHFQLRAPLLPPPPPAQPLPAARDRILDWERATAHSTLASPTLRFEPRPGSGPELSAGGGRARAAGGPGSRPWPLPQHQRPPPAPAAYKEEREYRCLGQWEEGGFTYTYTQRVDVGTYECFVGSIKSPDEIYIKEAGSHCQRDVSPLQKGMKLTRQGPCAAGTPPHSQATSPWLSSEHMPEPTKPWKPVTAPPRRPVGDSTGYRPHPGLSLLSVALLATLLLGAQHCSP